MSKLPSVTGKELLSILKEFGFEVVRKRGSHYRIEHPDGRRSTIPVHVGKTIGIGLLKKILKDCDIRPFEISESKANGKTRQNAFKVMEDAFD